MEGVLNWVIRELVLITKASDMSAIPANCGRSNLAVRHSREQLVQIPGARYLRTALLIASE
jgi:hypothetical protein